MDVTQQATITSRNGKVQIDPSTTIITAIGEGRDFVDIAYHGATLTIPVFVGGSSILPKPTLIFRNGFE